MPPHIPPRFKPFSQWLLCTALLCQGCAISAQQVRVPSQDSGSFKNQENDSSGNTSGNSSNGNTLPAKAPSSASSPSDRSGQFKDNDADTQDWPPVPQEPADPKGCSRPIKGSGKTYHVGPGQALTELTEVPWLSLQAGDVVNIHYRPEPYRTKFALRAQGSAQDPVVINGVTNERCERPTLSGQNAQTARDAVSMGFFHPQYSEPYGLILIYKSRDQAWGSRPRHIRIQNLKLTGAHADNRFTTQEDKSGRYVSGAAAIYAVVVDDLTVENCEITGNGNGVFVNTKSEDETSHRIVLRHNHLWHNGNVGSWFEHNLYIQAARTLYEGNHIGQLIPGARGSSLKDRSSATVVRFNRIDAAARALDLVEIEGGVKPVFKDPLYADAWVYGNLIVNDWNQPSQASMKLIHWGGDNDERYFRKGTLNFYHNTVVNISQTSQVWYVALFDMPTSAQTVRLHNNVFINQGSSQLRLGHEKGQIQLSGTQWISAGWIEGSPSGSVQVQRTGRLVEGKTAPALSAEHAPRTSQWRDLPAAAELPSAWQAARLQPTFQFTAPKGLSRRAAPSGTGAPGLGASDRP